MLCANCHATINPEDACKTFRMNERWVYYHNNCFSKMLKYQKNEAYKSINASQSIKLDLPK